jgi:hypothetical protein
MEADRDTRGQFVKGVSGNPKGRPRKLEHRHRYPDANRATAFEVAEHMVSYIDRDGTPAEMTAYQAILMSQVRKAMTGHTPSARLLMGHFEKAAAIHSELTQMQRQLFMENLELREQLETYRELYPPVTHGVVHKLPDGTVTSDPRLAREKQVEAERDRLASEVEALQRELSALRQTR